MLDYKDYIGGQISDRFWLVRDGDPQARDLFDRHYSRIRYADRRRPKLFVGPGEKMVLVSPRFGFLTPTPVPENHYVAMFVWRSFISGDRQHVVDGWGCNCSIFRNEGPWRSSDLILEAEELMQLCWPWHNRAYTYVDPKSIESANPGYCFKRAGWNTCGRTGRGLHVLEKHF